MSCYDRYKHEREGEDAARWGWLGSQERSRYDDGRHADYDSCERAYADGVDRGMRRYEEQREDERREQEAGERRAREARAYESAMEDAYFQAQYAAEQPYPEPPPDEPPQPAALEPRDA